MQIPAHILRQAIDLYIKFAYPSGVPASCQAIIEPIGALDASAVVPLELFERELSETRCNYALRLGQPLYPFMKLALDPRPHGRPAGGAGSVPADSGRAESVPKAAPAMDFLLRVDAHDEHLHAPPGSPDAAWLANIRASNMELSQKIETAWAQAGLPTFKEFLRSELEQRKGQHPA